MFGVDFDELVRVTCVRCGAARELPEVGGTGRLPAASEDGSTTLEGDGQCKCGATRIRVRLDFGD